MDKTPLRNEIIANDFDRQFWFELSNRLTAQHWDHVRGRAHNYIWDNLNMPIRRQTEIICNVINDQMRENFLNE